MAGRSAALDRLQAGVPDVLVVDRNLVDGPGDLLAAEAARHYPGLGILFVAGAPDPSHDGGPDGAIVLRRPFRLAEFTEALRRASAPPLGATAPG